MKRFFLGFTAYYLLTLAIVSAAVVWAPGDWFGQMVGHNVLITIIVACKPLDQLQKTMSWAKSTAIFVPLALFVFVSQMWITESVHGIYENLRGLPMMRMISAAAFILATAYLVHKMIRSLIPGAFDDRGPASSAL